MDEPTFEVKIFDDKKGKDNSFEGDSRTAVCTERGMAEITISIYGEASAEEVRRQYMILLEKIMNKLIK
jgi:hypothetical protein